MPDIEPDAPIVPDAPEPHPDAGKILSAFPVAGGIQVNRLVTDTVIDCTMVYPGEPGWDEAAAAAGYFEDPAVTEPPGIEDLRDTASLTRSEFLLRCTRAGVLTEAEALEAAAGNIPASFATHIEDWTDEYRFEAQLRWAALTQVDRNNELILMLAAQRGIPDEHLDAIFGISPGEPE